MSLSYSIRARKIARRLLYCLLFAIPFSVAAIEILFPLLLATWFFGWHWKRQAPSLWDSPTGQAVLSLLLAYTAVCSWSVLLSNHPSLSLEGLVGKTFEYSLFFIIASEIVEHPRTARRCIQILFASACLVAVYGMVQQVCGYDPIRHRPLAYGRMVGPYFNPNDLATFLMVTLLLICAHVLGNWKRIQLGTWFLGILLVICLVKTLSRGAFLGLTPGLIFLLFIFPLPKGVRIGMGVGLIFMAALILLHKGQILQVLFLSDSGSMERRVMWDAAWHMIQARPLMGLGLNTFMANYPSYAANVNQGPVYAHNCFLQIAAETGVLGLVCFLLFLGSIFVVYWSSLRATTNLRWAPLRPAVSGLMAGLMAFLVQSAFDTNLYALRHATLFWILAGVAFGISQTVMGRHLTREPENLKVMRVITRLNVGGPAQHVVCLSEGMVARGWATTLMAGEPGESEGDMKYLLTEKIRFVPLPSLQRAIHPLKDVKAFWSLVIALFKERPRILHTHTAKAGALGRSAGALYRSLTGAPLIIVHTFHGHVLQGYFNRVTTALFCAVERLCAQFTDRIVTVSDSVKKDLVDLKVTYPTKVKVISLGPSLEPFLKMEPPVFEGPLKIGVVGRLAPIKNHDLLFRAIGRLHQTGQLDHTQFLLVGDGELRATLEAATRKMEIQRYIQFLGWRSDLPTIYRSLHMVCLTSRNEGTPVAVIEAMAAARPVVATDVGGVRSLLGGSPGQGQSIPAGNFEIGQRGLLIPSEDVIALSKALLFLMTHPDVNLQIGRAGRYFVTQKGYSPEQPVELTDKLYRRLMRR